MNGSIERVLRPYLWVLMGGLLVQGAGSLIFRLIPALPEHSPLLVRGAFGIDFWHALIHIAWGAAGVCRPSCQHFGPTADPVDAGLWRLLHRVRAVGLSPRPPARVETRPARKPVSPRRRSAKPRHRSVVFASQWLYGEDVKRPSALAATTSSRLPRPASPASSGRSALCGPGVGGE